MPNEKSSSSVSSKRFFCVSVITLYASCFVSVGVRSGRSSRCSLPCTRTCGGLLMDRCRSEPCRSMVVFKSSGNVGGIMFSSSLNRLPRYLFYRRQTVFDFPKPAHAQRQHAFLDRLAPKLEARCADQHELAELVGDIHHFVET